MNLFQTWVILALVSLVAPTLGFPNELHLTDSEKTEESETQSKSDSAQKRFFIAPSKLAKTKNLSVKKEDHVDPKISLRLLKLLDDRQTLLKKPNQKKGRFRKGAGKSDLISILDLYGDQWTDENKKFNSFSDNSYFHFLKEQHSATRRWKGLSLLKKYFTKEGSTKDRQRKEANQNFEAQRFFSQIEAENFSNQIKEVEDELKRGNKYLDGLVNDPELSRL